MNISDKVMCLFSLCIDSVVFVQGPCIGNQQSLAHSRLWDAVVGFLHVFANMQMKLSQVPTVCLQQSNGVAVCMFSMDSTEIHLLLCFTSVFELLYYFLVFLHYITEVYVIPFNPLHEFDKQVVFTYSYKLQCYKCPLIHKKG